MRDVILPQAVRIAVAPTVGYIVQIIKGTSLAAIIGFTEVTRAGQIINNATFQPLVVFSAVGRDLLRAVLAALAAGGGIERRPAGTGPLNFGGRMPHHHHITQETNT